MRLKTLCALVIAVAALVMAAGDGPKIMVPATVTSEIVTNWTTVSRTTPVVSLDEMNFLVMRYDTLNQVGTILSNTVLVVEYGGKQFRVQVASEQIGRSERSISSNSSWNSINYVSLLNQH